MLLLSKTTRPALHAQIMLKAGRICLGEARRLSASQHRKDVTVPTAADAAQRVALSALVHNAFRMSPDELLSVNRVRQTAGWRLYRAMKRMRSGRAEAAAAATGAAAAAALDEEAERREIAEEGQDEAYVSTWDDEASFGEPVFFEDDEEALDCAAGVNELAGANPDEDD